MDLPEKLTDEKWDETGKDQNHNREILKPSDKRGTNFMFPTHNKCKWECRIWGCKWIFKVKKVKLLWIIKLKTPQGSNLLHKVDVFVFSRKVPVGQRYSPVSDCDSSCQVTGEQLVIEIARSASAWLPSPKTNSRTREYWAGGRPSGNRVTRSSVAIWKVIM